LPVVSIVTQDRDGTAQANKKLLACTVSMFTAHFFAGNIEHDEAPTRRKGYCPTKLAHGEIPAHVSDNGAPNDLHFVYANVREGLVGRGNWA
jgi:hypothetical protein